jgi:hypothetical protein
VTSILFCGLLLAAALGGFGAGMAFHEWVADRIERRRLRRDRRALRVPP